MWLILSGPTARDPHSLQSTQPPHQAILPLGGPTGAVCVFCCRRWVSEFQTVCTHPPASFLRCPHRARPRFPHYAIAAHVPCLLLCSSIGIHLPHQEAHEGRERNCWRVCPASTSCSALHQQANWPGARWGMCGGHQPEESGEPSHTEFFPGFMLL